MPAILLSFAGYRFDLPRNNLRYFRNKMSNGEIEEFDGVSLVEWTEENKICFLKEFGCNLNFYNPYENGDKPQFTNKKTNWF